MNALVFLPPLAILAAGIAQDVSGTRGPISIESVVGVAVVLVVAMFLWFLRWQKKEDLEERMVQSKTFEAALDRILDHDRENHEQTMQALREIARSQQTVAERLATIDNYRRPA